jgi:hypothetical protein
MKEMAEAIGRPRDEERKKSLRIAFCHPDLGIGELLSVFLLLLLLLLLLLFATLLLQQRSVYLSA